MGSNIIENFTLTYTFPGRYFLKDANNNFIYIKSNGTVIKSKIMTNEIKKNSYVVTSDNDTSGATKLQLPVFEQEWKDIFNVTSINIMNNAINLSIEPDTVSNIIDNDSTKFVLKYVDGNGEDESTTNHYLLHNNATNSISKVTDSTNASKFTIVDYNQAINQLFEPIIDNSMKLTVNPNKNSIDIEFNVDPAADNIDNFMIILAKYDYERNLIGHLKVHSSEEQEAGKSLCVMESGYKKCKYTLTDIDHVDMNGNILYYRVGVVPIDNLGVAGNYVEPIYPGGYSHFVMAQTNKEMERVINKIKEMDKAKKERQDLNDEIISETTGEYDFLKRQLGGYPDALIYDINKNTLNDLVDKSMSLGEINLNIMNM
jgi:hypothetical protein